MATRKKKNTTVAETKFDKEAILESSQFDDVEKDFLHVILPEDGMFTLSEVKEKLSECMKGEAI